jgi:hypothetical protein
MATQAVVSVASSATIRVTGVRIDPRDGSGTVSYQLESAGGLILWAGKASMNTALATLAAMTATQIIEAARDAAVEAAEQEYGREIE